MWKYLFVGFILLSLGCVSSEDNTKEMTAYLRVMGMDAHVVNEDGGYVVEWEVPGRSSHEGEVAFAVVRAMCKRFDVEDVYLRAMMDEENVLTEVRVC